MSRNLILSVALAGCAGPALDQFVSDFETHEASVETDVSADFVAVVDAAQDTLVVAVPGLNDLDIADAIVAAWDRGVDVRVVTDADHATDEGIVALQAAEVPLALVDKGITFFDFDSSTTASWGSDQVRMTHAFAVADTYEWVTATRAGLLNPGPVVWFRGHSEDLAEHFEREHNQLFGGTDAAAADTYNAPAKSINDTRWLFWGGSDESLRIHFGPQERLIKAITDAVYGARSSIRILAEDISDRGLANALQLKAEDGFDVEVIVGRTFGDAYQPASEVLRQQTPDVKKYQAAADVELPTLVFIDFDRARDGEFHRPRVLAITHPIFSAARTDLGVAVETDQYCDGTLMQLEVNGEPSGPLQDLAQAYLDTRAITTELTP